MTNFNIEVQKCVEILNNGGIILYPTDTIYGIGSDSHNNQDSIIPTNNNN